MKKGLLIFLLALIPSFFFGQIIDMDAALAEDSFRNGISAFHNGFLNKAYVNFEQALTKKPDNPVYLYWLAETYYRNGYNSNAIALWDRLIEKGYEVAFLKNRVEQVRRMSIPPKPITEVKYTVSHEIDGNINGIDYFAGPVAIAPNNRGGVYITSYLTGEILELTSNGQIHNFYRKKLFRYQRPFDFISLNSKKHFISEMGQNRINVITTNFYAPDSFFGATGRGEDEFNGPQFMAMDKAGYLYVTDVGNGRICKYTADGDFILSFGQKTDNFVGLRIPTGITIHGEMVVVADQRAKVLYYFDHSGNYLGEVARGLFHYPQGLTSISDSEILVADGDRLLLFNSQLESLSLISDFGGMAKQIVKADIDLNGNIVVSDFKRNKVLYLTDRSLLYSGLYLQIENVDNTNYPTVDLVFTAKDSLGRPFCGLDLSNFILEEEGVRIENPEFIYSDVQAQDVSVALLMDYSKEVQNSRTQIETALQTYFSSLVRGDYFALISDDTQPILQDDILFQHPDDLEKVESFLETIFDDRIKHDEDGRFDLGVHECVNRLLNYNGKRSIIYMTDGHLDETDFKDYNLTKIENYLVNNNIAFYYVQMVPRMGKGQKDLEYLAKRSGGKGFSIYSPMGVTEIMQTLRNRNDGRYQIRFQSPSNDDYGRNYLDLFLEVNHFNRTGRTVWGYYSPLDFKYKK